MERPFRDVRPIAKRDPRVRARGRARPRYLLIYGRLPQLRACEIARALADTLAHLHARGVGHRDVKPANIIVDDQHDALRVRLLDLGHASSVGYGALPDTRGLTQEREITGTVEYMAPEHIHARRIRWRRAIDAQRSTR